MIKELKGLEIKNVEAGIEVTTVEFIPFSKDNSILLEELITKYNLSKNTETESVPSPKIRLENNSNTCNNKEKELGPMVYTIYLKFHMLLDNIKSTILSDIDKISKNCIISTKSNYNPLNNLISKIYNLDNTIKESKFKEDLSIVCDEYNSILVKFNEFKIKDNIGNELFYDISYIYNYYNSIIDRISNLFIL